jgi:hypothetical protein
MIGCVIKVLAGAQKTQAQQSAFKPAMRDGKSPHHQPQVQ